MRDYQEIWNALKASLILMQERNGYLSAADTLCFMNKLEIQLRKGIQQQKVQKEDGGIDNEEDLGVECGCND